MILGASDFTKIKTQERPRIGQIGDPIAELTRLGWIIISPGKESSYSHLLFKTTALNSYEELCSLDVLGIAESKERIDQDVLSEFKSQLSQTKEGFYETGLIWKEGHSRLENNKAGSLGRLANLLRNLKQSPEKLKAYDEVISIQLKDGIVEIAP